MPARSEALLEMRPGTDPHAIDPGVEVRQLLWPLAIVAADEAGLRALERRSDVLAVHTQAAPEDLLARLDEPARLFAAAWNARRHPKRRAGDGLPWDGPGFDAP